MKILKIFGVVVGIHVFALILIFANPGCSSTQKSIPAPTDTLPRVDAGPSVSLPMVSNTGAAAPAFNPDAPALAAGNGVRFTPTRPGTPAASTLHIEPVVDVTPATTYTVATGDNLWSLSKKFNLTTAEIATTNNIRTNAVLHPGQKLLIPSKSVSAVIAPKAGPNGAAAKAGETPVSRSATETVKHVVKPGESLSAIAQQYGVKQGDIAEANNITDPQRIRAGTELTIPGWLPTTKSGKAAPRPATKAPPAKAPEPRTIFPTEPEGAASPRTPASDVPIIRVDEGPITPAPRNP